MKTVKDIEKECELETQGKTFDEKQSHKLGVFKAHYEISSEIIEMKNRLIVDLEMEVSRLKDKLEHSHDLLDNDKNYYYCEKCEKHYDTLDFDYKNNDPYCKICGSKINL